MSTWRGSAVSFAVVVAVVALAACVVSVVSLQIVAPAPVPVQRGAQVPLVLCYLPGLLPVHPGG